MASSIAKFRVLGFFLLLGGSWNSVGRGGPVGGFSKISDAGNTLSEELLLVRQYLGQGHQASYICR